LHFLIVVHRGGEGTALRAEVGIPSVTSHQRRTIGRVALVGESGLKPGLACEAWYYTIRAEDEAKSCSDGSTMRSL
jgi:hypothetical protein